jgi:hypothetical protein
VAIGATTFEIYLGPEAMLGGMLGIGDPNFDAFPSADIAAGKVFLALDCGGFGDPVEIVKVTALVPGGGTGRYQVTAVRGQWGTIDAAHDAWSTSGVQSVCAMFSSDTLARVGLPAPFAEEKFLLQPALAGRRADITTLTPISINVAVNDTPPPQNLRAFDDRLNPAYTTGQNIPFAWDLTAFDPEFTLVTELTCAELEIYDAAGTTLMTTIFPGLGVQTYLWTNVDLVTVLGSETDFHVRAYQSVNGVRSATYATLFVRKI